jgi:hypothetical protein
MSDEATQKNTTAFCEEHAITVKATYEGRRVDEPDGDNPWEYDAWTVRLICASPKLSRRSLTATFKVGTGQNGEAPKADDVLDSLVSDSDVDNYETFEDWAENTGYSSDSRKAENVYRACQKIAKKLRKFLGDDLLESLRNDYERL